jgi:CHAT domain-containing protein/tetratricopeptide (TPR) repeat protein
MIYKRYALFCFLLLAGTILPIVNERGFALIPSVMAQSGDIETLMQQAFQYTQTGKPQQAIAIFQQVLKLSQQQGNKENEAVAHLGLGFNYDNIGQPQPALVQYNQALLIFQELKDRVGEATTLNNIGEVYRGIGKPEEALKYYNQALSILRAVGDRGGEAKTLNNIGLVYQGIGKPEEALKYFNQSLPIRREVGDRGGEATTLNNIGAVFDSIGNSEEALKYYNQALPILRAVGDRRVEATTLNNIGAVFDGIGNPEEALKYYNQALPISREVGDRGGEATTFTNIGLVYHGIGKPEEALKYYNQALPTLREVGDRRMEAATLNNIGLVYHGIGKPEAALKFLNQALPILHEVGDRGGEAATLSNTGGVYRDTNQPANAIINWEASAEIYLSLRGGLTRENRADFINANRGTAIGLIDLLIRQNQPEKAYQWASRFTTFDLANYSLLINAKVANPEAQKALDNWNAQNLQLENLYQDLQKNFSEPKSKQYRELEQKINQQREPLINQYPELADLLETKPTDIAQLQKSIPPNTILLHPILLTNIENVPNTVALFRLTRDSLTVTQIPLPKDFNQLVNTYRNQLANYKNPDYLVTSSQLYDILIRPIEQQIKTNSPKNLAIIATDQLRYIPFESLYDSKTKQYLLQKYPISYLTRISTSSLATQKTQTDRPTLKALALANPKPFLFDTIKKEEINLKGTEKEAENLLKIFPQSETYLGEKATLDTFKTQASRFSILHLGTHGCFELNGCVNPKMEANTILFANNQQYNIADAALLGLKNTELITLSACQTAKEANANGQEISGLAYVLERAGAKSAIASLWNAEDNTSAEIMTQFYQNLQKGMTKSEAMQKAKLSQIETNPHPFFWSPFILIGDAQ